MTTEKKVKFSGNFVPCVTSSVLENFLKFFQNFRKISKNIEKCHFFGFFQKPKFPGVHFGISRLQRRVDKRIFCRKTPDFGKFGHFFPKFPEICTPREIRGFPAPRGPPFLDVSTQNRRCPAGEIFPGISRNREKTEKKHHFFRCFRAGVNQSPKLPSVKISTQNIFPNFFFYKKKKSILRTGICEKKK